MSTEGEIVCWGGGEDGAWSPELDSESDGSDFNPVKFGGGSQWGCGMKQLRFFAY